MLPKPRMIACVVVGGLGKPLASDLKVDGGIKGQLL